MLGRERTENDVTRTLVVGIDVDEGCQIEGSWGQYGAARCAEIADSLLGTAFVDEIPTDEDGRRYGTCGQGGPWSALMGDEVAEAVIDVGERALAALNEATIGGAWEWVDGELFLTATCEKCECVPEDGEMCECSHPSEYANPTDGSPRI